MEVYTVQGLSFTRLSRRTCVVHVNCTVTCIIYICRKRSQYIERHRFAEEIWSYGSPGKKYSKKVSRAIVAYERAARRIRRHLLPCGAALVSLTRNWRFNVVFQIVGTGSVAQWLISKQERDEWIGINLCWGFGVTFAAYICGGVSGK